MKKILYSAFVNSVISYGLSCYVHGSTNEVARIEKMQKNIINTLLKTKYDKVEENERFEFLNALPARKMYLKELLIKNRNINKKQLGLGLVDNKYNTRWMTSNKMKTIKINNRYEKMSEQNNYARIYNKLPQELKTEGEMSITTFKAKITAFLTINSTQD